MFSRVSLVVLAGVGLAAAPQRPPTQGTAAISGVVIDGETHRPIAGALVYLGIQGRGPVNQSSRQLTDPKGRFVYTDLPASDKYFMNASKAGYIDGHYGDTQVSMSSVGSGVIRLGEGQWFDGATIPLWRPGVIAGAITDERGEPVVGAHVRLLARVLIAGLPHLAASTGTVTDDRGRYRIAGLPPGKYIVSVPSVQTAVPAATPAATIQGLSPGAGARGQTDDRPRNNGALDLDPAHLLIIGNYPTPPASAGAPQAYPMAFYPGATLVGDAMPIDLKASETRDGVDISLRPRAAVRVSGRIDGAGDAARGMVLRLIAAGMEDLGDGSEVATTLVAAGGAFTFLNVPAGDYTLVATRSSLEYSVGPPSGDGAELPGTPGEVPGPGTFLGGIPTGPPGTRASGKHAAGDLNVWARLPISVGPADVTGVSVTLRRAMTLSGRIAWDGDGPPPGATAIIAEPADGSPWLGMQQSTARASIGGDEAFTINGLLPGGYMVRVVGLTPLYAVKSVVIAGRDYSSRPIDVTNGQDLDGTVVTLTDHLASIVGTVDAGAGGPSLMTVIAFPVERDQWTRYGLSAPRFKTAPVSNMGLYAIDNIPAGKYFLVAVDSADARRWQDPAFLQEAARTAPQLAVTWGEKKTQDLRVSVIK